MGNDDGGAAFHKFGQGVLYDVFALGIDGGGGLIEHEHGGVMHVGADEGNELALAYREHGATLHYVVLVLAGQLRNEVVGTKIFGGLNNGFHADGVVSEGDVVVNGIGKQEDVLQHNCDVIAEEVLRVVAYAFSIDKDFSFLKFVKATEEVDNAGFARTGGANQGQRLAAGYFEGDVFEHIFIAFVGKPHVFKLNFSVNSIFYKCARIFNYIVRIEHAENAFGTDHAHLKGVELICQFANRAKKHVYIKDVGNKVANGNVALQHFARAPPHNES